MKTNEESALNDMRSQEMFLTLMAQNTKLDHIRKLLLPHKCIIWDGLFPQCS